jgi:hypothetical protein
MTPPLRGAISRAFFNACLILVVGCGADGSGPGQGGELEALSSLSGTYQFFSVRTARRTVPGPGEEEPCLEVNGAPTCSGKADTFAIVFTSGQITLRSPVHVYGEFPSTVEGTLEAAGNLSTIGYWDSQSGCSSDFGCLTSLPADVLPFELGAHLVATFRSDGLNEYAFNKTFVNDGKLRLPLFLQPRHPWRTNVRGSVAIYDSTADSLLIVTRVSP